MGIYDELAKCFAKDARESKETILDNIEYAKKLIKGSHIEEEKKKQLEEEKKQLRDYIKKQESLLVKGGNK